MTKKMNIQSTPVRRTQGFTLIEMLVVAALIAIFAGLAVFNIVEQLQREKEKAALAEARSIATAMSFAHDDLGFFPKLCFLKYGVDEMLKVISDENLPDDAIDYMGRAGAGTMLSRINKNWGEKYMAGSMPEKFVTMQIATSGGVKEMQWPADPFRQPYVLYLTKIDTPNPGQPQVIDFIRDVGESPNYFAGVVSYGRNKAPGLTWDETDNAILTPRRNNTALFLPTADPLVFQQPREQGAAFYNQARLDMLAEKSADIANEPNIRDAGSDDKFFEF